MLIDIDGVPRPVHNSLGECIHSSDAGIANFWRWFGNSKAVDAAGRPLVLYHGTDAEFSVFDIKKMRAGRWGKGFYFADSTERAVQYGETIIASYLKIEDSNPRGGDGMIIGSAAGNRIYMVWRPEQIMSVAHDAVLPTTRPRKNSEPATGYEP